MVHALEEIRRVLKPRGLLIDIHPHPHWLYLQAMRGEALIAREPKPQTYSQAVLQAEAALAGVIERGLFLVEKAEEVDFLTYARSVDDLRRHWNEINAYDEDPVDAQVAQEEEEQYARFHSLLQTAGEGAEVAIHEKARMARLRPGP